MFPAGEPHIRVRVVTLAGGLRLRIAEAGRDDAPVVLLLHGWGASIYMWRSWFAPLAAAGRRVVAVDLPGHGLSDKPEDVTAYRLAPMMQAVRELLDAEGLSRVDMVAQSMAGTIALELLLAGEPRIARLALVNPAVFGVVPLLAIARVLRPRWVGRIMSYLVTRRSVARAHRLVYGDPSRITQQDVDQYWAPSQFPEYARAIWRLAVHFEWARPAVDQMAARLREVRVPIQVILGGRDRLVRGARRYVDALRARGVPLEVSVLERGGHAVNEERADEVIGVLSLLRHVDASDSTG
jgi:pimeloyl-ACP methyl ester carboxylesterase